VTTRECEQELSVRDYRWVCDVVRARAGIALGEHKMELVRSRLGRRLRATGLRSIRAYCERLRQDTKDPEVDRMVGVVATHLTAFFREPDALGDLGAEVLPRARAAAERGAGGGGGGGACAWGF
jgi:chemotaxis protein methyltransferase CheR